MRLLSQFLSGPRGLGLLRHTATVISVALLLTACGSSRPPGPTEQQQRAHALWQERCKKSGVFIYKTVDDVAGVFLLNLRMRSNHGETPADQFALDDPYGKDVTGDGYISIFLRNSRDLGNRKWWRPGLPRQDGYLFVEAVDPKDGKLYRYTGRVVEPWQEDKKYAKGYLRFEMERTPISQRSARYGVKFEDISTREERELWIAGSSLKVMDLDTGEVLAERVGYMLDWGQGARGGGRSPWLHAANDACPAFGDRFVRPEQERSRAFSDQTGQTPDFTELVLKPKR